MNDTYCALIYKGLYLEKTGGETTNVSSCCVSKTHETQQIDFVNDPVLIELRQSISKNTQIPACDACWSRERMDGWSIRRNINHWWKENSLIDNPYKVELKRLDYNVDPICNAKCIICSPWFSSLWAQEEKQFRGISSGRNIRQNKNNNLMAPTDFSALKQIYFNGGEPLATTEHREVLEMIVAQKDIKDLEIAYNTNGSMMPDADTLSLWKKAKHVLLNLSIDAQGKEFEYIRYPLKWSEVENNISWYRSNDVDLAISCTAGLHNLLEVDKLCSWAQSLDIKIYVQPCQGLLSVSNGSLTIKTRWIQMLEDLRSHLWADELINTIKNSRQSQDDQWIDYLEMLDQRRGNSWRESLPNLSAFY